MSWPERDAKLRLEKRRLANFIADGQGHIKYKIEFAQRQLLGDGSPINGHALQFDIRRQGLHFTRQRDEKRKLDGLSHPQNKALRCVERVEISRPLASRCMQDPERAKYIGGYRAGERARDHALPFAEEQGVVQLLPQTGEGAAYGRLGYMELFGSLGQCSISVDGFKDAIEIEVGQIHKHDL
jgi:hypothetical protein